MSKRLISRALSISAATILVFSSLSAAGAEKPETEVRQAAERFYKALNTMFTGDATPMLAIWSHSGDVTYMGPFGKTLVGWKEVRPVWEQQADLELGGSVQPVDLHIIASDDLGVTMGYERGTNYQNGKPLNVNIRATNVFRRENGEWKMIGHHTDLFPWAEAQ